MKFTFDWKEYASIAREMVSEGCVLLKNENHALPIRSGERVSVFGRIQLDYYKSGMGSGGMVNAPYVVSILDGLKNCPEISLNEELLHVYEEWVKETPFDAGTGWTKEPWCQKEMIPAKELVKEAAFMSDIAVIILGRSAGEDKDNSAVPGSYLLTEEEEEMLSLVCENFGRTAVVLNVGNIIDMKWVEKYRPQAVLYAWQGGMEGGNGVADILTGKVSPSGKLSDTVAYDIADYPSAKNFGGTERNFYTEDIYVGYRYFETAAKDKVMYPFGFGLSYTEFDNHVTGFDVTDQTVSLKAAVKNIGEAAGREVLQVYYCPPQGKLAKPLRNLIRFQKTNLLAPGEEQELSLCFKISEMASYDDGGFTGNKSCYVLEAGNYEIYVGNSVRDVKMAGSFRIGELLVIEECTEACAPVQSFERMRIETGENVQIQWEEAPKRTADLSARIRQMRPRCMEYTGDRGWKLEDVRKGRITMEEFLAQLSDRDLICLTRGEGMCSPKVTPGIAAAFGGVTESLRKFGIPAAGCADGPSGIRMDCGTKAFSMPNGTLIACSFHTELAQRLYEMEGMELRKNKIDSLLGPGVNIHRNPLNGRNFEYFSEDPYLTGAMAAAELKGLHKYGVTGTIKHFACNNQETARTMTDSVVSERALREIYLKAYEMCVKEAGARCIMSTYGPLNGLWTAGNYDLITMILRGEWGYKGLVMTDWWAKINEEGEAGFRENTTPMVRAQNDIYMVVGDAFTNSSQDNTQEGLASGKITRGELVRNAANICRVVMHFPAMEFFMGVEDECEELNVPESALQEAVVMAPALLDGESLSLDLTGLKTDTGSNIQYSVKIPRRGKYRIEFRLKSDLGELAQMTMSVSLNNALLKMFTVNGTGGKWEEYDAEFDVFSAIDNYLNLYFAQSGIDVGGIRISFVSSEEDF